MFRQMSAPVKRVQEQQQQQQQQRMPRPTAVVSSGRRSARIVDYTVMWVSGECGISLRNFSSNKIGAQIAVLQQANGVTTGISNCRLGDQLLSVNDDHVETMGFKDIVEKLKTTRRPITLGFRTTPSVATSPVASSSSSLSRSSSGRFNSARTTNATVSSGSSRQNFFPSEDEAQDNAMQSSVYAVAPLRTSSNGSLKDDIDGCGADERPTDASVRSSTSTLSDEVEVWCKEQEEMHSGIIVLLTETVMRCEKLQQETMDQVSHWMQLANLGSS
uniref:PDZ domain-containing protein n=1 Tax=Globisporangium ultimum (strain ATCC 200006 / CBS 805.95 / DAOM BR144) TaxID=431595 RepID=K3WJ41_GLOUD